MSRVVGVVLVTLCLPVACSEPKKLDCADTVAHWCATYWNCALTWDAAQTSTAFCDDPQDIFSVPGRADCGGYHVVTAIATDMSQIFYYDAATGMLVAVVGAGFGGAQCVAGPADGFMRPTCTGDLSEPLPQCLDGGADATSD